MRKCFFIILLLAFVGCGPGTKPSQPLPAAPPSLYPIDFPLEMKWEWRGQGLINKTPVADSTHIYVTTVAGYCYAINPVDGKLAWMFKAMKSIPTPPLLAKDRLIFFSSDDEYYELKPATGEIIYKDLSFGKPTSPGTLDGDFLYFVVTETQLRCSSTTTHKLVWKYDAGGKIAGEPAVKQDHIYFGALDGTVYCLRSTDGSLVWKCPVGGEVYGRPAVSKELVVVGTTSNQVVAIHRAKGTVAWCMRTDADVIAPTTVFMNKKRHERIFAAGFDNYVYCFNTNGNMIYRTAIPARMYDELLVDEHMMIIAPFSIHVTALNPVDGSSLSQLDLTSESRATPLLAGGRLYMVMYDAETSEGILQAFATKPPPPPQTQPAAQTQPKPQTQPATQSQPAAQKPAASVASPPPVAPSMKPPTAAGSTPQSQPNKH